MRALFTERRVAIPEECTVTCTGGNFVFKGPLGTEKYDLSKSDFTFEVTNEEIIVKCWHANRSKLQLINTIASHIRNYMTGVTVGFKYVLKSVFRHFPVIVSIEKAGKEVKVHSFIGSKDARQYSVRGDSIAVQGDDKDTIYIQGTSIADVSQTAASISSDSFKRKRYDERIFLDGIYIAEKTSIVSE